MEFCVAGILRSYATEVNRVIIHVEDVTFTDSFSLSSFVAVCIHRTPYQMSEKLFFCHGVFTTRGGRGVEKNFTLSTSHDKYLIYSCDSRKDFDHCCSFANTWLMELSKSLNNSCFSSRFTFVLASQKLILHAKQGDVVGCRGHVCSISRSAADVPHAKTRVGAELNNESNKTKPDDQVEGNVAEQVQRTPPEHSLRRLFTFFWSS